MKCGGKGKGKKMSPRDMAVRDAKLIARGKKPKGPAA